MPTNPDALVVVKARELLRAELGIAPGEKIEVWGGVSVDQALRAIEAAIRESVEEAARVADVWAYRWGSDSLAGDGATHIATAIRALTRKER